MKTFDLCGPMLTIPEAQALSDCVKQLPENPVIVQIGAYLGISTCAMLEARPDAFIFSIDIKPRPEEKQNLIKLELDTRQVVRVLGNSQKMHWPYQADMLYIDGDHRYNGVKADCENWIGKVRTGGLIVFHDYIVNNPPPKNQVAQVVNKFFQGIEPHIQAERIIGFER